MGICLSNETGRDALGEEESGDSELLAKMFAGSSYVKPSMVWPEKCSRWSMRPPIQNGLPVPVVLKHSEAAAQVKPPGFSPVFGGHGHNVGLECWMFLRETPVKIAHVQQKDFTSRWFNSRLAGGLNFVV